MWGEWEVGGGGGGGGGDGQAHLLWGPSLKRKWPPLTGRWLKSLKQMGQWQHIHTHILYTYIYIYTYTTPILMARLRVQAVAIPSDSLLHRPLH